MTKHYEKYQEEVTREKLVKIACDRCGAEIPQESMYRIREFELHFLTGDSYPDNGYKEGWEVPDLCDSCVEWLKSILTENGVKLSKVEIDW